MKPPTVAVVDYGMGNLRSVAQALQHVAAELAASLDAPRFDVVVTSQAQAVLEAERVLLPGQGAMPDCMAELERSGLRAAVLHAAAHKPLLGVCVGMQMLLDHSEEGDTPSLGLIPGHVRRFRLEGQHHPDGSRIKVPQMGWNQVWQTKPHPLWHGIPDGSHFYFVHSFHAQPSDPSHWAAYTDYGLRFASAVARDNCFATQFHPEKSAAAGLTLLRNFLRWQP